ncbi:MAG TPA: hypothetical protein VF283_22650 [Bryobacteraceae bacterium]
MTSLRELDVSKACLTAWTIWALWFEGAEVSGAELVWKVELASVLLPLELRETASATGLGSSNSTSGGKVFALPPSKSFERPDSIDPRPPRSARLMVPFAEDVKLRETVFSNKLAQLPLIEVEVEPELEGEPN